MKRERFSFLWIWLLLPIFGIPSIGGQGLHLFLEGPCVGHLHVAHPSVEPTGPSFPERTAEVSSDGTGFPTEIASTPESHDEDHCFLCHFLTQSSSPVDSAPVISGIQSIDAIEIPSNPLSSSDLLLHSGRSPPVFLS